MDERVHRARWASHELCDLRLRKVLVEMQDESLPLPQRKTGEFGPKLRIFGVEVLRGLRIWSVPQLDPHAPEK